MADSFENPLETSQSSKLVTANQSQKTLSKAKISKRVEQKTKSSLASKESKTIRKNNSKGKFVAKKDSSFAPKPYRLIIRLPSVNPSAPAETVTRALQDAGVIFEVEKIERLDKKLLFKDSSSR